MAGTILLFCPDVFTNDGWPIELEQLGYTVLSAEEPGQALVHVQTGTVDLVVIDCDLESCDEVMGFVSMLETEPKAPPLVLASACPQAPTNSVRLGAAAFLPKPCLASDLTHVMARVAPNIGQAQRTT